MTNVTPIFRCNQCNAPAKRVDVALGGEVKATIQVCDTCIEAGCAELAQVRPVFDAMTAQGVPRDLANAIMSNLLDDARWAAAWKGIRARQVGLGTDPVPA